MEMDSIVVFVKVVQAGSFTEAARMLAIPKTTASSKIARLEQSLGVTLIQRTTRKLNVTPAGQAFYKRCLRALTEIEAGQAEVSLAEQTPRGLLRITVPVDLAQSLLAPLVSEYLRKYPDVRVDIFSTNKKVDLVSEGVDLAIRAGELKDSTLIARKFLSSNVYLWASQTYLEKNGVPQKLEDLPKHQFLLLSMVRGTEYSFTDGHVKVDVELQGRLSASDFVTLKNFIIQGDGIGLAPQFLVEKEAQSGAVVKVLPDWYWGSGALSFVYPAQQFVPAKVQAFIEMAYSTFK